MTNANSEVGSYAFTTLDCIPGDLEYRGAKIQLLDVPGVVQGAAAGTGRGKEVLQVVRNAELIVILLDVNMPHHYPTLLQEIRDTKVRINQKKPDVKIKKKTKGGISVGSTVPLEHLNEELIADILKQFRIMNADVLLREDITVDQFIDVIEANRAYVPAVTVLNKVDMAEQEQVETVKRQIQPDLCISASTGYNLENLKELIFEKLAFMPIYCKEYGKDADTEEPLIMREGATIRDMCTKLHKDFVKNFRYARVWGDSAKFPGQKQSLAHTLAHGDIVEIRTY